MSRLISTLQLSKGVVRDSKSKEEGKDQESIQSSTTPYPRHQNRKVTKTQENITYKRAKRAALSQKVIPRLQENDKTV